MKRTIVLLLSFLLCFSFFAGCSSQGTEGGGEEVKVEIPQGYRKLTVNEQSNGKEIIGISAELDPHFFSNNVGLSGTFQPDTKQVNGPRWEVKESDWDDIFVPRMREMNLKRIRMMILPHYYCPTEGAYNSKNYDWNSKLMQSVYKVLDTAQELGMYVNMTMWGVDTRHSSWLAAGDSGVWCCEPQEGKEPIFADLFATLIQYLREEKGYTCVQEITLYNEPNAFYNRFGISGHKYYVEMCKETDAAFREKGIRGDVKFNLSDDARDSVWLGKSASELEGIADYLNSHTYDFTEDDTNAQIQYEIPNYNLKLYMDALEGSNMPHMFGEFGTGHVVPPSIAEDRHTTMRGLQIARIATNMLYMGSCGFSHWTLFSQYYDRPSGSSVVAYPGMEIMNMGLWGFADEGYKPRPTFYAYSLLCRYVLMGAKIYPVETNDENLVSVALQTPDGKWTYLIVNDSTEAKKVAFANMAEYPQSLSRYVYDMNNVPTDGKQITSDKQLTAAGRVIADEVAGMTFAVYSNL